MSVTKDVLIYKSNLHNWDPKTLMDAVEVLMAVPSYKFSPEKMQDLKELTTTILCVAEFNMENAAIVLDDYRTKKKSSRKVPTHVH